jgi:hypothetical protein
MKQHAKYSQWIGAGLLLVIPIACMILFSALTYEIDPDGFKTDNSFWENNTVKDALAWDKNLLILIWPIITGIYALLKRY